MESEDRGRRSEIGGQRSEERRQRADNSRQSAADSGQTFQLGTGKGRVRDRTRRSRIQE